MKRLYKFLLLVVLALAWSCGEDDNLEPIGEWTLNQPTLTTPGNASTIILDEGAPAATSRFEWAAATTTNERFTVLYNYVLVPSGSDDYSDPILSITPGNGGKALFVEPTAEQIDYALWAECYPAGATVNLKWAVIAKAIEKESVTSQAISFKRFETEHVPTTLFITGDGTEKGTAAAEAMAMRGRTDGNGDPTHIFDVYTTLTAAGTYQFRDQANELSRVYGGSEGDLEGCGEAIAVEETGQYRVTVDLNDNSFDLLKIDRWSLVGDAVEGGWGGDVPLTYQGNGVWSAKLEFYRPYEGAGFVFRANGDWGYLLKRVQGTATPDNNGGEVVMESEAGDAGLEFEDVPGPEAGAYTITLNLAADGYTYQLAPDDTAPPAAAIIGETTNPDGDAVSGNFVFGEYDVPDQLFLVSDGQEITELIKDEDVFRSEKFLALEAGKTYMLNSASDGSGTTYNDTDNISVARDQAYQITVNFENGKLTWKYYNIKLFHWDEVGGGWDSRTETLMTYVHPYTFEASAALSAGFHSKFNSPWEVQFGTDATTLSGTMTNGGSNYTGIAQSGTYEATITVSDDYSEAEYSFVKQ